MFLYEIYKNSQTSALRDVLQHAKKHATYIYDKRCQDIKSKFITALMESELLRKRAIQDITNQSKE